MPGSGWCGYEKSGSSYRTKTELQEKASDISVVILFSTNLVRNIRFASTLFRILVIASINFLGVRLEYEPLRFTKSILIYTENIRYISLIYSLIYVRGTSYALMDWERNKRFQMYVPRSSVARSSVARPGPHSIEPDI